VKINIKTFCACFISLIIAGNSFAGSIAVINAPLDEHIMIAPDASLKWSSPSDYNAVYYDVYLHTNKAYVDAASQTAKVSAMQTEKSYLPPAELNFNTTYYWRIDSYNSAQIKNIGKTWSFTTAPYSGIAGDITNDGSVDFYDIAKFSAYWCIDYNFIDLANIAANWQTGTFPKRLHVMTFNTHHAVGNDGVLNLERIALVIEQAQADIVALQEVENGMARSNYVNQAAWLGSRLNMYYYFGPAAMSGKFGNAILSKYPIEYVKNYPLPHYADEETRACILSLVNVDGRIIGFLASHFDFTNNEVAVMQANEVMRISALVECDKLFAGDLNTFPYESPVKIVLAKAYIDTFNLANNPTSRIDYVFVSKNLHCNVFSSDFVKDELTAIASDSYPILTDLLIYSY
jgi:endonuclease/exonuclease/phosphatase family metal-dependent hydrolase